MSDVTSTKVIINMSSGPGHSADAVRQLSAVFAVHGAAVDISVAESGPELLALARAAAREQWTTVVAGGGDGTIHTVAANLIGSKKILGILPFGTLNHFARDLNIPKEVEDAVRTIVAGHTIDIDVGSVNDQSFINNSSLGLYPIIVHEREKQQRLGSRKWPAFAWAAFTAFRRYPFLDICLIVNGKELRSRTPFVFIGNNEYPMEAFNIGVRKRLDAGHLSVYITHNIGRWGLVRLALRGLFGRLRNDKDFLALHTTEVTIQTRRKRLHVALDGEVDIMKGELHYRIVPQALRVLVPRPE